MATKREMSKYKKIVRLNSCLYGTVPYESLNVEECLILVKVSGTCLRKIPLNKRTKKVCVAALENDPSALKHVPDKYKTEKLCMEAYKKSVSAFPYLLETMYSRELCVDCYERIIKDKLHIAFLSEIACAIPIELHNDERIFALERELRIRRIVEKVYVDGRFYVKEETDYLNETLVNVFDTFEDFYAFINGDLSNANLLNYDFSGVDISQIDVSRAYVKSDVLIKHGKYSNNFYKVNVQSAKDKGELVPIEKIEVSDFCDFSNDSLSEDMRRLYYISDLHLNHKLQSVFPESATENEVRYYICELIEKMISTRTIVNERDYLLIAGDVSYNYKIAEMFYCELVKRWDAEHIIVVLGNHDLWNYGTREKRAYDIEYIIKKYRKLFERLKIRFVQNELLLIENENPYFSKVSIVKEEDILSNSIGWLKERCKKCNLIVLGGIGFSGENAEFNASHGIYRNTITSLNEDKKHTKRFKDIYNKVKSALKNSKVVVITHMPHSNWSNDQCRPNWIYVNGHTHKNTFTISDEKVIYADNQVGYYTQSMGLKHFELTTHYDIFCDYQDGIHFISREDYINFNRGINVKLCFNRSDGKIIMLKRSGLYCFFYKSEKEVLYFLKGGSIRKLSEQNIQYYYDTMNVYKIALQEIMKSYHANLKLVSNHIKRIGGSGRIHGCIVDIDYFNHIYVDPFEGTIRAYNATSTYSRIDYPTVEKLLECQCELLYLMYKQEYIEKNNAIQIFHGDRLKQDSEVTKVLGDTSMYRASNMFRSLQYMFDVNVIREWNEELVNSVVSRFCNDEMQIGKMDYVL